MVTFICHCEPFAASLSLSVILNEAKNLMEAARKHRFQSILSFPRKRESSVTTPPSGFRAYTPKYVTARRHVKHGMTTLGQPPHGAQGRLREVISVILPTFSRLPRALACSRNDISLSATPRTKQNLIDYRLDCLRMSGYYRKDTVNVISELLNFCGVK